MIFNFSLKDVEFLFILSANITIHHKAVYKCSVDNGVTVHWQINEIILTHTKNINIRKVFVNYAISCFHNLGRHKSISTSLLGQNFLKWNDSSICKKGCRLDC